MSLKKYFVIGLVSLFQGLGIARSTAANNLSKRSTDKSDSSLFVVFLGDSNLWTGGEDSSGPRSWSHWFCQSLDIIHSKNYARSGATWSHTPLTTIDTLSYSEKLSDNNVIINQVYRLINDKKSHRIPSPNYIFIMAGTNDAWFRKYRPTLFSSTDPKRFNLQNPQPNKVLSLSGSIMLNSELLRQHFPTTKIILLSPLFTTQAPDSIVHKVSDIIENIGHSFKFSVIRLDRSDLINSSKERNTKTYTLDGTHTNPTGAALIGKYIGQQFITKIIH